MDKFDTVIKRSKERTLNLFASKRKAQQFELLSGTLVTANSPTELDENALPVVDAIEASSPKKEATRETARRLTGRGGRSGLEEVRLPKLSGVNEQLPSSEPVIESINVRRRG